MAKARIPSADRLYTVKEIAPLLKLSEKTVRRMIEGGELVEGTHWFDFRRRNGANRSPKLWLEKIQEFLAVPAAFR